MSLAREPEEYRNLARKAAAKGDLDRLEALAVGMEAALAWKPEAHQIAPGGDWWAWLLLAGKGSGKTDAGASWFDQHMSGPACSTRVVGGHRGAIVAPTHSEGIESAFRLPSSIQSHNPAVKRVNRTEGVFAVWPNGAEARIFGAASEADADRLRGGGNNCVWWLEEAAVARHLRLALDNIVQGARLGSRPRGVITTTPKPRPEIFEWVKDPGIAVTHATTFDNPHNPKVYVDLMRSRYEGTRLGQQEIYGELLADYEGALWNREWIERDRLDDTGTVEEVLARLVLRRVLVGIDPSTWDPDLGDDPGTIGEGLETGIVVAGIDSQNPPHVFILEDASMRGSGEEWARRTAAVYHRWVAQDAVPEVNLGGLVLSTLRLVDPSVHLYRRGSRVGVHAAQGKRARAEPVATLAEQGRLHHVGHFPVLESQLCGWDPRESWSPDRLDALVWAVTALEPWGSAPAEMQTFADVTL